MYVVPDSRESVYYDILKIMSLDSEQMPHYFTVLTNRFKILGAGEVIPFCKKCCSSEVFERNNNFVCSNDVQKNYKINKVGNIILDKVSINEINSHEISYIDQAEAVDLIIDRVCDTLKESGGYRPTLFQLENYLWTKRMDDFFETINGEVSKAKVIENLLKVQDFINERLSEIRTTIRFSGNVGGM